MTQELSRTLGEVLLQRRLRLAVAESCTGGWVAKCITDIAGSSQWFDRGFVTYSNQAKQDMLDVQAATLQDTGAVSEATVTEMVRGVLRHSEADIALAVSGIAGPGGEVSGKPVGTVCFAWARRDGPLRLETRHFDGDRAAVRRQSVAHALDGVLRVAAAD
ncbi:MAG: nicotinamide-nucleotide amidohydrolase family protein [Gammaproteobacteria bacterium]|jgi:nicotinamide-nucleotide amidase